MDVRQPARRTVVPHRIHRSGGPYQQEHLCCISESFCELGVLSVLRMRSVSAVSILGRGSVELDDQRWWRSPSLRRRRMTPWTLRRIGAAVRWWRRRWRRWRGGGRGPITTRLTEERAHVRLPTLGRAGIVAKGTCVGGRTNE